eukprot:CAMPEP_0196997032 /NCGR_PEP_ID=MMETSP1380-20130617/2766_1 /TAXON_ID=5936 /ORGANISM="Euplotes crassus, Strain CT5" /LENGTH=54 /DNA_ID=CAMNT_0042413163 /DNA_START=712 /DNA_END=873 /DNA_ORIENTATION=+
MEELQPELDTQHLTKLALTNSECTMEVGLNTAAKKKPENSNNFIDIIYFLESKK